MKNFRRLIGPVIGILFLAGATLAWAHGGGPPRGDRDEHQPVMRLLERVNLTNAQIDKIATILKDSKTATEADRHALRAYHEKMAQLGENGKFNEAEVRKAFQQIAPHLENLAVAKARVQARIMGVLTPEQSAKIKKDFARKRARMRQMWRLRKLLMENHAPTE